MSSLTKFKNKLEYLPLLPTPLSYCTAHSSSNFKDDISVFSGSPPQQFPLFPFLTHRTCHKKKNGDVVINKVEEQAVSKHGSEGGGTYPCCPSPFLLYSWLMFKF
jgi:hypothetical protein